MVILNDVMNCGDIQVQWKQSSVLLVYKGGEVHELKKYRPIAILNVISSKIVKLSLIFYYRYYSVSRLLFFQYLVSGQSFSL